MSWKVEYTPYGQQWVDEGTDKSIITYRFTSKEYDSETGLYYYGVRYLDPVTARWMTPDPALQSYLPATPTSDKTKLQNKDLPGNGGIFNPFNLDLYGYSSNNPVKYLDPSGLIVNKPTSSDTMQTPGPASVHLGNSPYTLEEAGCVVTVCANEINTINNTPTGDPRHVAPAQLAQNESLFDSGGGLYIQKALQEYTHNPNLAVLSTPPNDPQAAKATLSELQTSSAEYLVMGVATIQYKENGQTVTSSHAVNITDVHVSPWGNVFFQVQPTSANDIAQNRQYTFGSPEPNRNIFQIGQLFYVKIK